MDFDVLTNMASACGLNMIQNQLASFRLSYLSPDNLKIDEICKNNEKSELEFGGEKSASSPFEAIDVLNVNLNMQGSKKY